MKYLVLWTVLTNFLVPCTEPNIKPDIYGREQSMFVVNAVACWDSTEKQMSKEFSSYEEALQFVNDGKRECMNEIVGSGSSCIGWEIVERKL